MSWSEQLFRYCERGLDTGFLAEPLNALSSLAFLLVAGSAAHRLLRNHAAAGTLSLAGSASGTVGVRTTDTLLVLLVVLVAAIGLGSFLFHVTAARWAQIADVAPITIFMLAYLALALREFLELRWSAVALGVTAFVFLLYLSALFCQPSNAPGALGESCLNGSARYIPALLALAGVGWLLQKRAHPAAPHILTAAAVFLVALVLRTLDLTLCAKAGPFWMRPLGLHFLWHLLNAATLHLLLGAAIGARQTRKPVPQPPA